MLEPRQVHALLIASALGLLGEQLTAQTTWIVDALNRPGAHFVDLPPAVNAAARGDILLVRHVDPLMASYTGTLIDKALTIVGIGGKPGVTGILAIESLPAGDHVLLRDLRLAPFPAGAGQVGNCQLLIRVNDGSVHLHDVDRDMLRPLVPQLNQTGLTRCGLVTITECTLSSTQITDCTRVAMTRSAAFPTGLFETLLLDRSRLVLIDSTVTGTTAVRSCDAELWLAGNSSVTGRAWAVADGTSASCRGASTVITGPTATLGPVTGNPLVRAAPVTALGARIDANNDLHLTVTGAAAGLAVLSAGAPIDNPLSLWGDLYYLDPPTVFVFGFLPLDATGRGAWQAAIPPGIATGSSLWLQSLVVDAASNAALTTAAVVIKP